MMKSTPFRIFYTSLFSILIGVVIALLVITPVDCIRQCLKNNQIYNIFVIAGSYLLTVILGVLIYASRIYTTRSVLAAIPKTWIPIEKGDVSKRVRRMIVTALERSIIVAWDAQPRVEQGPSTVVSGPEARIPVARAADAEEEKAKEEKAKEEDGALQVSETGDQLVVMPPLEPSWNSISHNGWASPSSPDWPNLEYDTVVSELPHLIEARAVSLAPPDADSSVDTPLPDIRAVEILQRPAMMGLRDYIAHLTRLGVIPTAFSSPAIRFLEVYEFARFAARPLSEAQFRILMKEFADVLSVMQPFRLDSYIDLDTPSESDIADDGTSTPAPMTPPSCSRSRSSISSSHSVVTHNLSRTDSGGTIHTTFSRPRNGQKSREVSAAPASPSRSRNRPHTSKTSSYNSFAQSREPFVEAEHSATSSESLRSLSTQPSVIRLK